MKEFKNWHDIQDWAKENGFKNIVKRMQINNDYWNSSGEFKWHWVDNGEHIYKIYELDVID